MRILQVRFKNLNSLVGEWNIDLAHPRFASDGIFAITGPTGAGKTTILDAICLALYGRTPRLNKVTKSSNEIMSRQTAECFAEVTFETQTGRFRCHWSQHRARKKPDGDLQSPKHEIAHADTGEIFESNIRGVADQIEEATGMDFDRFTRSMLLAQGGFAAFLQASPDERAPILEQITGTEIYSLISMRVHQRRSEERNRLENLRAELTGMQILSEDEEGALKKSFEKLTCEAGVLHQQIKQKMEAIGWIEGIASLEKELKQVKEQEENLNHRLETFAPQRENLKRADLALELSGEYCTLTARRQEKENDQKNIAKCKELLPAQETAAKQAESGLKEAECLLKLKSHEQKTAVPLIRKVREIDTKVQEKDAPLKTCRENVSAIEKSLKSLQAKQKSDGDDLDDKKKVFEELSKRLADTKGDEGLVEHLSGISAQFDRLQSLHQQLENKRAEIEKANQDVLGSKKISEKLAGDFEKQKKEQLLRDETLRKLESEQKSNLKERRLSDWQNTLASLTSKKSLFEQLEKKAVCNEKKALLSQTLTDRLAKMDSLEKERDSLEAQLTHFKKIEDLVEARHQLQDGEPCPLCGAKDHPYAEGNIPLPGKTNDRLAKLRSSLKTVNEEVSDLKVRLARLDIDLEHIQAAEIELKEKIKLSEASIAGAAVALRLDPDVRNEIEAKLAQTAKLVEAAEKLEKQIDGQTKLVNEGAQTTIKLEHEAKSAQEKAAFAEKELARLKKEAGELQKNIEDFFGKLQRCLEGYGLKITSMDQLDQTQNELKERKERWSACQREKLIYEQMVGKLENELSHQKGKIKDFEEELIKQKELLSILLQEMQALKSERMSLFGSKNADEEEARLSTALEEANHNLELARQMSASKKQGLETLKSRIDDLEKSIIARDASLKSEEEKFLSRLKEKGFLDEDSYKISVMPENERKALAETSQKLSDEKSELTSRKSDKTKLLEAERKKRVAEKSLDELKPELKNLEDSHKTLQQQIGGIDQRLKDNENVRKKQQEKVLAVNAQKDETSRWDNLHELIGSVDGKKYRIFAQGLTFELMIKHANQQLRKMSDRYLLEHDSSKPLELKVVDNYQAAETRTTKNLSGGESFLVSLSLALGLSNMASKKVRVDSLFLDEGFGTLDDEALDTALEVLGGLKQEGKLIGVISHVPALKERIGTQIQVSPQNGGRSTLSGPGCSRSA